MASLAARSCFFSGFSVQSFCLPVVVGVEGAPYGVGYVKFDKTPPLSKQEEFSDFLVVMDSQGLQEAVKHAKEKSIVILNSAEKPNQAILKKRKLKIYSLDATGIALNALRKPAPDAVMLGALVKACNRLTGKAAKMALGENRDLSLALDEGFRNVK